MHNNDSHMVSDIFSCPQHALLPRTVSYCLYMLTTWSLCGLTLTRPLPRPRPLTVDVLSVVHHIPYGPCQKLLNETPPCFCFCNYRINK